MNQNGGIHKGGFAVLCHRNGGSESPGILTEAWRGQSDALTKISGISDMTFCVNVKSSAPCYENAAYLRRLL